MAVGAMLTDEQVEVVARLVLGRELHGLPLQAVEVRSAADWTDEPSIYVTARLGPGVPPLGGAAVSRVHGVLHEALLEQGETRFPYLRLSRSDDQVLDHADPAAGDV